MAELFQKEVIRTDGDFAALKEAWSELLVESDNDNLFLTWEWLYNWWLSYKFDKQLYIVLFKKNNRLVSIFPLYAYYFRSNYIRNLKEIRLIGTGEDSSPDYMSLIYHKDLDGEEIEVLHYELFKLFRRENVGRIQLFDYFNQSAHINQLRASIKNNNIYCDEKYRYSTYIIDLPESWKKYELSLSSRKRKNLKQLTNKINKNGIIVNEVRGNEINASFDSLVSLHHKRWFEKSKSYSFDTHAYRKFHLSLMRIMDEAGNLKLFSLESNKKIIAFIYCYIYRSRMYYIQSGFDPEYSEFSPGTILIYHSIRCAIENECNSFDMLKGDHDYKKLFMNKTEDCTNLVLYKNMRTFFIIKFFLFNQRLKNYIRRKIKSIFLFK